MVFSKKINARRWFGVVFLLMISIPCILTLFLMLFRQEYDLTGRFEEHFVWRQPLLEMQAYIDRATGQNEINGVYVCDNQLIDITESADYELAAANSEAIKKIIQFIPSPVYFMLVPTANVMFQGAIAPYAQIWDQSAYINEIYSGVVEEMQVVSVYDLLMVNRDRYLYYRTENQLTSLGGYYLYQAASRRMGLYSYDISEYSIEYYSDAYYGNLFERTGWRIVDPDRISLYSYQNRHWNILMTTEDSNGNQQTYTDVYVRDEKNPNLMDVYFGGSFPLTTIENVGSSGKRLLLIGDDTIRTIAPFLMAHYRSVTMINEDLYQGDYSEFIMDDSYDQILIMFSIDTFNQEPVFETGFIE